MKRKWLNLRRKMLNYITTINNKHKQITITTTINNNKHKQITITTTTTINNNN